MFVLSAVRTRIVVIVASSVMSGCSGGGGNDSGGGSTGPTPYLQPARYAESSYSQFTSQRGTADLTGTWMLLIEGTMENGETPIVTGGNYKETFQYFARALLRITKNPNVSNEYYVYTCGPGGARDTSTTYASLDTSLLLPYFYYSTTSWTSYRMNVVDAVTLRNTSVVRDWNWYGTSGWAMSYNLSFTYKRISDDPFAAVVSITDLNSSQVTQSGCVYEAEGTYIATQNDQNVQNFSRSGTFYRAGAYQASPLNNNLSSYSNLFSLLHMSGYYTAYGRDGVNFNTRSGDTITAAVSINANATSYSVQAVRANTPGVVDNAKLDITP